MLLRNRKRFSNSDHKLEIGSTQLPLKHETPSTRKRRKTLPPTSFICFLCVAASILILFLYSSRFKSRRLNSTDSLKNVAFVISQDELMSVMNTIVHKDTCVMTISSWREYGFVINLYESLQIENKFLKCFLWFVADDPFLPDNTTMAQILFDLKKDWNARFPIVTFQLLQQQLGSTFDPFARLAFASSNHEDAIIAAMIPFAYLYSFEVLGLPSIIYLKKDLWVSDPLTNIITPLSQYNAILSGLTDFLSLSSEQMKQVLSGDTRNNIVENSTYEGTFDFNYLAIKYSASTKKLISQWIEMTHTPVAHNQAHKWKTLEKFFLSQLSPGEIYLINDEYIHTDLWNPMKGFPLLPFSRISLDLKSFYTWNETGFQNMELLSKYLHLWVQHKGSYYRSIPFGFNHFMDGTIIEPWMHQIYQTLIQPVETDGKFISPIDVAISNIDVYTRLQFQKNGCTNPFLSSSGRADFTEEMTFSEWLLRGPGPLDKVIDMNGLYYFTTVEEYIAKDLKYPYPVRGLFYDSNEISETKHDPTGTQFDEFKSWFDSNVVSSSLLPEAFHEMVEINYRFHRDNHWSYHRKISSSSDLGLNMIGWHGGIFGLGIQASKLFLASQASGLSTNAIPLKPMLLSKTGPKYLHPDHIGYNLTRSCSEAVNLVLVNADYTAKAQQMIPELIWRFKYTIGYFEWELDVFPESMMKFLKEYDEVWVSTTFIANSIMNTTGYTKIPVKVIPIPLSFDKINPSNEITDIILYNAIRGMPDDAFVFLVVFDYWSCVERKNPEAAIRAFLDAFPLETDEDERHRLIIKSQNGTPDQIEALENVTQDDPRIEMLTSLITLEELNELQNRADCYVSLHRSEGFGMNILEEMGRGIPVITTNYSGNVDFFSSVEDYIGTCIFPVPYKLIELNHRIGSYEIGNHWADPDHSFAVEAMRTIARNDCKQKYGKKISDQVFEHFGVDAVGRKMKNALFESYDRIQQKQESFIENRRMMISG